MAATSSAAAFTEARDFLLKHRSDYDTAYRDFRWPQLTTFNWALDHFDAHEIEPSAREPQPAQDGLCPFPLRRRRQADRAHVDLTKHRVSSV